MANNYMHTSFSLVLRDKEQVADVLRFVELLNELENTYYDDDEGTVPEEIQQFFREPLGDNDVDELYRSGNIVQMQPPDEHKIWFYAEEAFNPNYFNLVIRYAMRKYRIERMGYSWAYTCSKPRLYQFGGEAVVFSHYGDVIRYSCTDDVVSEWEEKRDALRREESTDYIMRDSHPSVWITVKNLSVYIKQDDDGVSVDIYPLNRETDDSLAGTWALYPEEETNDRANKT